MSKRNSIIIGLSSWDTAPSCTLMSRRPASLASVLRWLRVHSSWPRLSYADSSSSSRSRRVSVFVCSVLLPLESKSRWAVGVTLAFSQNEADATRGCRTQPLRVQTIEINRLPLCASTSQYGTAKAPARSLPPPPSATTAATPCRPASRCSSRCLREDWTTVTIYCHLMPRWWVKTPGPSWPQIR